MYINAIEEEKVREIERKYVYIYIDHFVKCCSIAGDFNSLHFPLNVISAR